MILLKLSAFVDVNKRKTGRFSEKILSATRLSATAQKHKTGEAGTRRPGKQTRTRTVGGKRSHHCATSPHHPPPPPHPSLLPRVRVAPSLVAQEKGNVEVHTSSLLISFLLELKACYTCHWQSMTLHKRLSFPTMQRVGAEPSASITRITCPDFPSP